MRTIFLLFILFIIALPAFAVQIVTGTYTGDGTDNRNITISPACQPKAVFVGRAPKSSSAFRLRTDSMSGDLTHSLSDSAALSANFVQALNSDGFQIGTGINVNTANYAYAALCDNGGNDFATGSYLGDGTDNVDITISPAFQPEVVIVVPSDSSANFWRGATSHSGDSASFMNALASSAVNRIQAFNSNGFQVGSQGNTNAVTFHYVALKGNAAGVASGNFSGNATDNRDITVGFSPSVVIVKGDSTNEEAAFRLASHSGDDSFCDTGVGTTDIIQGFGSTTFQVGTDACSNESGVTMRWLAFTSVFTGSGAIRRRF